jgi:murein DD-endopeptidase MepM/ murein hydrolase activator NlpD
VRIDHENGYETLYAHASDTSVELGEEVRKNEVIALSGSTGISTAPHLHFEILLEGEPFDPLELVQQP